MRLPVRLVRLAALPGIAALSLVAIAAGWPAWPSPAQDGPAWPQSPSPARIRYVTTIAEAKDIGAGPGWLSRVASAIIGKKRQPRLLRPRAVVTDHAGRLLVADPEQQMVHVLDVGRQKYSLSRLRAVRIAGRHGGRPRRHDLRHRFRRRRRIFVYTPRRHAARHARRRQRRADLRPADGDRGRRRTALVYVVDTGGRRACACCRRVERCWPSGAAAGGGRVQLSRPTSRFARTGGCFVVDAMNARRAGVRADGPFVRQIGRRGNGSGDFDKPKGVALDADGHIYIAEGLHDVVQVFDTQGRLLLVFGGERRTRRRVLAAERRSCIDASSRIYVADALNGRVQVFQYVSQPDAN